MTHVSKISFSRLKLFLAIVSAVCLSVIFMVTHQDSSEDYREAPRVHASPWFLNSLIKRTPMIDRQSPTQKNR
jgi:hypothetical protein